MASSFGSCDPTYFCSICGKISFEEISHKRHEQYCRKQASRRPRPKACLVCRRTKSKCNFGFPCSRCASRQVECSYVANQSTAVPHSSHDIKDAEQTTHAHGKAENNFALGLTGESSAGLLGPVATVNLNLISNAEMESPFFSQISKSYAENTVPFNTGIPTGPTLGPGDWFIISFSTSISTIIRSQLDIVSAHHNALGPQRRPTYDVQQCFTPSMEPVYLHILRDASKETETIHIADSCSLMKSPNNVVSNSCLKHIMSILRTYPRMMMKPNNLPPFVHPLGAGLDFDQHSSVQIDSYTTADFAPLQPLAECISIARLFNSRTPNADQFLWRTIDNEHHRLNSEFHRYSKGEVLAAIQAMVIYLIMRMVEFGPECFRYNKDMPITMMNLCKRLHQLHPDAFNPCPTWSSPPSWEEWIFVESVQRVTVVSFLLALLIGSEPCNGLVDPRLVPLTSSRALWEARNSWEWEMEYNILQADSTAGQPRVQTVSEFAIVKHGVDPSATSGNSSEALDDWHASVDGLGMMLAAVLAEV